MLRYMTIPGVILTSVCGEYLLVATKSQRGNVPFLTQLNDSSAFLWRLLEQGSDESSMERAVIAEYEIDDPTQVRTAIKSFVEQMLQAGYLLKEGEKDE